MKFKNFFATLAAIFFVTTSAAAQVVTVQGSGLSEDAAIKAAKRAAVEAVVGTLIQSRAMSIDSELIFDAVQSRTQGYVTSCEVIKKTSNGGVIFVTAQVDVSAEPDSALMKDIELVMTLNDPRLGVVVEHYGDDGGETFKKHAVQVAAVIREELIKSGFTHVIDSRGEVDYVIIGQISVGKAQEVRLPDWRNISGSDFKTADTGLSRSTATLDCKLKKFDTDEVIGEFRSQSDATDVTSNELNLQVVTKLATDTAGQVRAILSREASKAFSSVKIIVNVSDGEKVLTLEEILHQTQGVNNVYVRSFRNDQCIVDVGTDLTPQNLYRALVQAAGEKFPVKLSGFSSITLEISL